MFSLGNGQNDKTLTFCCNQGVKNWESGDNPWLEHKRYSPFCSYVLLNEDKYATEEMPNEVNHAIATDQQVSSIKLYTSY